MGENTLLRRLPGRRRLAWWGLLSTLLLLSAIAGPAAAYQLSIDAPESIQVGMPLVVNGTSTLPAGISVDVVFSRTDSFAAEVARKTVTLQSTKEFKVVFDTTGLPAGMYKVEVPRIAGFQFLGDSITLRVVKVIDRTSEIEMRSPRSQEFNGVLRLSGVLAKTKGSGVQVQVFRGDESIFGPTFIETSKEGVFSKDIAIDVAGTYEVTFTDNVGYIGKVNITVTRPQPTVSAAVSTVPATPRADTVTASAPASRDKPAYFLVTPKAGTITVTTSAGIDWVIEYATGNGPVTKVNNAGSDARETVSFSPSEMLVSVMVYPYRYSDSGEVTLSAQNAEKIEVQAKPLPVFAASLPGASTTKTPLPGMVFLVATGIAGALLYRRR